VVVNLNFAEVVIELLLAWRDDRFGEAKSMGLTCLGLKPMPIKVIPFRHDPVRRYDLPIGIYAKYKSLIDMQKFFFRF